MKYAAAHDLRRSFGTRWASDVMPATLQQMMRHQSIETTRRSYVTRNAQATAALIRAAYEKRQLGYQSGNRGPSANKKGPTTNRRKSL